MSKDDYTELSDELSDMISLSFERHSIKDILRKHFREMFPFINEKLIVSIIEGRAAGVVICNPPLTLKIMFRPVPIKLIKSLLLLLRSVNNAVFNPVSAVYDELQIAIRGYFFYARILTLCVSPEFRRRGVALNLVKAVTYRYDKVVVITYSPSTAQLVYIKCGFICVAKWYNFIGNRDVILFAKKNNFK